MATAGKLAFGCDLGGTNLRVAVVDGRGSLQAAVKRPLGDRTPSVVAADMAAAAREAAKEAGVAMAKVEGVGVGVAGQVLGSSGVVLVGPNLGWRDVRFGALLQREFGRPVRVVNDLAAAAWGEAQVGAARGARDAILVYVGTGVGSGLILDGKVYEGSGGIAGEFGHVKVVPGGRRCGCGELGCLEAYVGGANLAERLRQLAAEGRAKALLKEASGDPAKLHAGVLDKVAEAGDAEALAIREEAARFLGVAVANLVTVLNPQKLILGGGVLAGAPGLKREAIELIRKHAGRAHLGQLSTIDAALGDDGGVIGAALLGAAA